jgi:uncharacterized membrane protein
MPPVSLSRRQLAVILGALLVLTLILAWWSKARCLGDGGWQDGEQYMAWCYTDIYPLWWAEGLDQGATPYVDHPVEYPVLIGTQMWVAAGLVRAFVFDKGAWATAFFHTTVLLSAPLYALAAYRLYRMGVSTGRLLWVVAVPTFVVYAFMNWDAAALALAVLAVEFHRRDREVLAGAAAGLGAAAKLFPGFLVPIVVVARLRRGQRREALEHAGAAGGAWLAVNLPVMLRAPDGWAEFLRLNRERPADWDSLWFYAQQTWGATLEVSRLNLLTAGLFVAGCAAIIAIGQRRLEPSEQWRLLLPVLCWFLLTNKVYSPQFSIWLLPLMALALPRPATFAAFAMADLFVFAIRFPFLGGGQELSPAPGYDLFAVAILARAVVLAWVIAETLARPPTPLEPRPPPWSSDRRSSRQPAAAPAPTAV